MSTWDGGLGVLTDNLRDLRGRGGGCGRGTRRRKGKGGGGVLTDNLRGGREGVYSRDKGRGRSRGGVLTDNLRDLGEVYVVGRDEKRLWRGVAAVVRTTSFVLIECLVS